MFELCCEISIAEVGFHFNLVRIAVQQLRNSVALQLNQKIASEIKKIKLRILRFACTG